MASLIQTCKYQYEQSYMNPATKDCGALATHIVGKNSKPVCQYHWKVFVRG